MTIDLNCDVGESFGPFSVGQDDAIFDSVTSVNVACGAHAGDPTTMRKTVRRARQSGLVVGAHPGFPDFVGFGRRDMVLPASELEDILLYQLSALAGIARIEGVAMRHVKPHGALYNMATRDADVASAIVSAIVRFDSSLLLYAMPASCLARAGSEAGLRVVTEAFVDRQYEQDGTLSPRSIDGAVIRDADVAVARAVRLATMGEVVCRSGQVIKVPAQTLCLHGDTAGAGDLARRMRSGLLRAGVTPCAPSA